MPVTVLLFARLRELAGCAEWRAILPAGATAADVWQALVDTHPPCALMTGVVSVAINAEFARFTAAVQPGDEVAFLPPVSGG
jgi:molybdopterin synthase sulfur carrier subunit